MAYVAIEDWRVVQPSFSLRGQLQRRVGALSTIVARGKAGVRPVVRAIPLAGVSMFQTGIRQHRQFVVVLLREQVILHAPRQQRRLAAREIKSAVPVENHPEAIDHRKLVEDVVSHNIGTIMREKAQIDELRIPSIHLGKRGL